MIIAIPVDENRAELCVSFGRAPFFAVCDAAGEISFVENPGAEAQSGAGVKAAQCVVDSGADAVITVRCGENSAQVMQAADIVIYAADGVDLKANLAAFEAGTLSVLDHFTAGFMGVQ